MKLRLPRLLTDRAAAPAADVDRLSAAGWPAVGRRFVLHRTVDHTGMSGTGVVADGVLWPDSRVTLRWRGPHSSTVNWDGIEHVRAIHGHDGATMVVWLDPDEPSPFAPPADFDG